MRSKAMVALARLVLSKRERVIALEPYHKGLLGTTLRYPYEVRPAADYFGDLPYLTVAPDMLTLAEHILDSKAGGFEPASSIRSQLEGAPAFGAVGYGIEATLAAGGGLSGVSGVDLPPER
jgi:DNA end-binding protein Ku